MARSRSIQNHLHILVACGWILGGLSSTPALASDGVYELNHACAIQSGCFAGDTLGYPITITTDASYRLTSNLVVPDVNTTAILVSVSGVNIDLNGFTIVSAACEGPLGGLGCASAGSGVGVAAVDPLSIEGVSVRNGAVVGMGSEGILLGRQARVRDVRTRWNQGDGISVRSGSGIYACQSYQNGGTGIRMTGSGVVAGSTSFGDGGTGIFGSLGANIAGNTVVSSGSNGIASFAAQVHSNAVNASGAVGIQGVANAVVSENAVTLSSSSGIVVGNGSIVIRNVASDSTSGGIRAIGGSSVDSNVVLGSGSFALELDDTSAYRDNTIGPGGALGIFHEGIDMGGNSCDGATSCP